MKNILRFFFLLVLTFGCSGNDSDKGKDENIADENFLNSSRKYTNLKGTLRQTIYVSFKDSKEDAIKFKYIVKNNKGRCKTHLSGNAKIRNPKSNPEVDEDSKGISYPSMPYIYEKGNCWMEIRIAMKGKDKVKIKEDCPVKQTQHCPLGTSKVLKLTKQN